MKNRILFLFALLVAVVAVSARQAGADDSLETQIATALAARDGISAAELSLTAVEPIILPVTGAEFYRAKAVDAAGEVHAIVIDAAGVERDLAAAQAAEAEAYAAVYGKLTPDLHSRVQALAADERLTVAVWLVTDGAATAARPDVRYDAQDSEDVNSVTLPVTDGERASDETSLEAQRTAIREAQAAERAAIDALRTQNAARLQAHAADAQAGFLSDLAAAGVMPTYISPYAPLVYVNLTGAEIQALSDRADVEIVFGPNDNQDLMSSARPTQKADRVDDIFGFDGTGVDLAILEDSRIDFSNPFLPAGTTRIPADPNMDNHATATAGMVASTHATHTGIARGVSLFSANGTSYSDPDMSDAIDWAAGTQNVDIINNSWGGNTGNTNFNEHDRHLDYVVRNQWSTVTVAAGNEGGATNRVTSPARGYNVISVGNFNDNNSLTWTGDSMNGSSSWVDPSTGMEKPEVAGSGTSINSTLLGGAVGNAGSGTSYAAPMVAGEAALLMDRNSSLTIRPEAVKSIIMASALNNIEGSSRLSEYDGAGGVDMHAAFRIVDEGWWDWRSVSSASFPYSLNIYADAGETVRAVIAWDSTPNGSYTNDPLQADIDLRVYSPSSAYVTGSTSIANSYEIVEFVAATSGTYELRIDDWSFNGTTEYIGTAWWTGHAVLSADAPALYGTPPVGRDYLRFTTDSDWNLVAMRVPTGADYDLALYPDSAFGNPDDYDYLSGSTYGGETLEYVMIDRNHAPSGDYFMEARTWSGTGSYRIEHATTTTLIGSSGGIYGPYTMAGADVGMVFDTWQSAGVTKYYAIIPTSGSADLGLALYDSDPADSDTFYRRRSQSVRISDAVASAAESFNYQTGTGDWLGLAVWKKDFGTQSFYIYADTDAPTGAININAGDAYANSTAVTLNVVAADSDTGVSEMRFSNNAVTWTAWQAYSGSRPWVLPAGDGAKTVYAQFRNPLGLVSTTTSDVIVLDTTAPTASIASPSLTLHFSFPVSWSGSDTLSGVTGYDVQYRINGGPWLPWLTNTALTAATFGPNAPVVVAPGNGYQFRVRARDAAGNVGAFSPMSSTRVYYSVYLPWIARP